MPDDNIQVHEGRRAGIVVSVRLKADEADLLEALSERAGRTLSETLRVALHNLASRPPHPGLIQRGADTRGGVAEHIGKLPA